MNGKTAYNTGIATMLRPMALPAAMLTVISNLKITL